MSDEERILELIKTNGGLIKTSDVTSKNINKMALVRLMKKGLIDRIERGLYIDSTKIEDSYYVFQYKCPKAIFSHETALFLQDMTDRDPLQYTVTMKTGRNPSNLTNAGICVYTVKEDLFSLGQTTVKTIYGHDVRTYNVERTVCDVVRSRNSIDGYIFAEALKKYAQRKDKDLHRLMEYAKMFHVDSLVKQYMEVLL